MTTTREQRYREYLTYPKHVVGGTVEPRWVDGGVAFTHKGAHHVVDTVSGARTEVPELPDSVEVRGRRLRSAFKIGRPAVHEVPSPDGAFFATESGADLALRWAIDDRLSPLTTDGDPDFRWDVKGASWSPDGLRLAARRVDTRRMERFPVVHWLKPREEVELFPAGRVGGAVEDISLYVINRLSREVVRIDSGPEPEQDLRPLGWSADASEFYYLKTNRYKKPFVLMAADPRTGASRVVHEERSPTWVSFWEKGLDCVLLPSRVGHVWLTERDGWAHLYLHDMNGQQINRITGGEWAVTKIVAIDERAGWVYVEAHSDGERPYDTHIGRARLDGTAYEQLTDEPGTHHATMSPDLRTFIDNHSSMSRPPACDLRAADGMLICRLAEAEVTTTPGMEWTPPEEFTVPAADGETTLYGHLYFPSDFDPSRTYPLIESIYAGPNSAFVPTHMLDANAVQSRALAELGFVVMMLDARGTPERSKAFHDVAYRNFADSVIPDHAAAIRQLGAERPYLDLSRVGVYGRSYGGYFTARALLEAPDVYHVGVAVNGVYEMREGNGPGPIECVMGALEDNVAGYDALSLYPMIPRLAGRLLIVHGTSDVNVPFAASLMFAEQLTLADKAFDFLPVNEQPHHFTGVKGTYLSMAKARYFCEHLGVDAL